MTDYFYSIGMLAVTHDFWKGGSAAAALIWHLRAGEAAAALANEENQ